MFSGSAIASRSLGPTGPGMRGKLSDLPGFHQSEGYYGDDLILPCHAALVPSTKPLGVLQSHYPHQHRHPVVSPRSTTTSMAKPLTTYASPSVFCSHFKTPSAHVTTSSEPLHPSSRQIPHLADPRHNRPFFPTFVKYRNGPIMELLIMPSRPTGAHGFERDPEMSTRSRVTGSVKPLKRVERSCVREDEGCCPFFGGCGIRTRKYPLPLFATH
ncbi:hypothetical protein DFP72DRAFT_115253 [Ephemerocybe angulata]|uniref:Uncharacterized protein n=1 Tax=Ephemerocybe angulata TaxID=980116 RepID=A0A8H6M8F0_9AGAR|nr:hypothetical protein DFP72DRAFT_115253 [Tulosesus angulatus]